MTTLIITKQELFNLVNQETVYLSDPVGSVKENSINRLADVLPMTEDDRDYFNIKLFEIGVRIFQKITPYTKNITQPYTITDPTDLTNPNSIIYKFELPLGAVTDVATPLIQQYIVESIVKYIVKEWLKIKGYSTELKDLEFNYSIDNIKSAFMHGRKATLKYRTL